MRTALSVAAIVLVASQLGGVRGQTQLTSYGAALSGTIQSPICSPDNFASGDVSGDLNGSFYVAFDCHGGTILGGSWLILATAERADGAKDVLGTIRGQVLNGSFEPDGDSRITVRDVALAVTEGTGQYATVPEGSGSLEATSDIRDTPQFVGRLGLTFSAP
jgi:hypothetical protein